MTIQLISAFVAQLIIIRLVGVGLETDAYIAAQAVPSVLVAIITSALQCVWLPRLTVMSSDVSLWRKEQSIAQGQCAILAGGILFIAGLCMQFWLPLLYPGFEAQQLQLAMDLSLIMLIAGAFNTQSALLTVALRAKKRFLAAEVIALMGALLYLGSIFLALPKFGLLAVVWIALIRDILVYVAQMVLANWPPLSFSKALACKETWLLMRPLLFGSLIYKSSPLIDRHFASLGKSGDITILSLGQTIISNLSVIVEKSVGNRLAVRLIENLKIKNLKPLSDFHSTLIPIIFLSIFLSLIFYIFGSSFPEKIGALFGGSKENGLTLTMLVIILAPSFVVSSLSLALINFYYFHDDTKTPVIVGMVGHLIGIFLKAVGFYYGGMLGLVLASSMNSAANMTVNYIIIKQRYT